MKALPADMRRYHLWVSEQPCASCGDSYVQVAHYHGIRKGSFGGGMGKKSHHLMVAPLCQGCHAEYDSGRWQCGDDPKGYESEIMLHYIAVTIIAGYEAGVIKI